MALYHDSQADVFPLPNAIALPVLSHFGGFPFRVRSSPRQGLPRATLVGRASIPSRSCLNVEVTIHPFFAAVNRFLMIFYVF